MIAIKLVKLEGFLYGGAPGEGEWVTAYDPDYADGAGAVVSDPDVKKALRFPTLAQAVLFYTRPSRLKPWRPDGEPNCPLKAYTVSFEEVESVLLPGQPQQPLGAEDEG